MLTVTVIVIVRSQIIVILNN